MDIDWQISAPVVLQMKRTVTGDCTSPAEVTPGALATYLAVVDSETSQDVDLKYETSSYWENSPTSYSINIDVISDVYIDENSGRVFIGSCGTYGEYTNVTLCATNECGTTCTDPFTMTTSELPPA